MLVISVWIPILLFDITLDFLSQSEIGVRVLHGTPTCGTDANAETIGIIFWIVKNSHLISKYQ